MTAGLAILAEAIQHTAQFNFNLAFVVNKLPLWFLVFALFLPRLAMVVAWFQGVLAPFHLLGIIPTAVLAVSAQDFGALPDLCGSGFDTLVPGSSCGGDSRVGRRRSPAQSKRPSRILALRHTLGDGAEWRVILRRWNDAGLAFLARLEWSGSDSFRC